MHSVNSVHCSWLNLRQTIVKSGETYSIDRSLIAYFMAGSFGSSGQACLGYFLCSSFLLAG